MSNIVVKESAVSNRAVQLRETMLDLVKFDVSKLDIAKVIYYKKKDVRDSPVWIGAIWEGLGLYETHPELIFNVEVTMAQYSTEMQCYELSKHKIPHVQGRSIPAYLANHLYKELQDADLVRIDATKGSKMGKPYNISCVLARNDLES